MTRPSPLSSVLTLSFPTRSLSCDSEQLKAFPGRVCAPSLGGFDLLSFSPAAQSRDLAEGRWLKVFP